MDDNKHVVYCHTNKINGKKYIGITQRKPSERWMNGKGYNGQPFYQAIKEYGWDSFYHEILFEGLSGNEARQKERLLIALYETENEEKGYNGIVWSESEYYKITPIEMKMIIERHKAEEREYKLANKQLLKELLEERAKCIQWRELCFEMHNENCLLQIDVKE